MHLSSAEQQILNAIASSPTLAGVVRATAADFSLQFPVARPLIGWNYAEALDSLRARGIVRVRDNTLELSTAAFEDILPLTADEDSG